MKRFCINNHDTAIIGRYKSYCRQCNRDAAKRYAVIHPQIIKSKSHTNSMKDSLFVLSLRSNPCFDCKDWFLPWQMEFDHLPAFKKMWGIHRVPNDRVLFNEIAKCQLVCANCHRNRTYERSHA